MNSDRKVLFAALALIAVVALTGTYVFLYMKSQDLSGVEAVKKRISRHYVLPENEQPALVTITDSSKLTSAFLKQSKNEDKVLIYQSNRKAIIYRPSIDRIIDIAPVVIDSLPTVQ